jgi:hypothetical protein
MTYQKNYGWIRVDEKGLAYIKNHPDLYEREYLACTVLDIPCPFRTTTTFGYYTTVKNKEHLEYCVIDTKNKVVDH